MAEGQATAFELAGPFGQILKSVSPDQVFSLAVRLRAERNPTSVLNPVGQLRRVVSGQHIVQDAVLFMGVQFFEIFSVVRESQQQGLGGSSGGPKRGAQLKSRLRSVANSATGHIPLPKRLRHGSPEDADEEELGSLESVEDGGTSIKDHVFSVGVAFAQIVRIRSKDTSITVFYHPNTMKSTKLSKNNLASSMRFTFCLESEEETTLLLKELEKRMNRYLQASMLLGEHSVIPSALHLVAITQPVEGLRPGDQPGERVLRKEAPWGVIVDAPEGWGREAQDSEDPLWAYLMTPLGYGKCNISPQTVSLYRQGREAHFYVGVRHPQMTVNVAGTDSRLREVRGEEEEPLEEEGDDSEEDWQPEESDESVTAGLPVTRSISSGQYQVLSRNSASLSSSASSNSRAGKSYSRSRGASNHGVGGRHVRVHCTAKYVEGEDSLSVPEEEGGGKASAESIKSSAAGASIAAEVAQDDSEDSVGERRQRIAREYGFSDDVVERYMLAFHGDESMAHRKMAATYEWKKENGAAGILKQPQPHFQFFKKMFRHGLLGTTKEGHPVWFMKVGDMKAGHRTFKDSDLTDRELARHVAFCMDYNYNVVEAASLPNGRALWVLDLKGMGISDMGSPAFEMGKEIAAMISAHWPERLHRAFIINMPGFFSILWKIIEPMMAATTRKKIRLLRGKNNMLEEMLGEMEVEDIPVEYGGQLKGEVYNSRKEKELWKYVESLEADASEV